MRRRALPLLLLGPLAPLVVRTRRLPHRAGAALVRTARKAWHRWCISSNDQWIAACAADGILDSNSLRAVRDDTAAHRVVLALLESEERS